VNQLITGKYVELKNHCSVIFSSVGTLTAWPQKMFSQLQLPISLLTSQCHCHCQAVQTSVEWHDMRKIIYWATRAGTEMLTPKCYLASQTYVGHKAAFWNSTSVFQSLTPFAEEVTSCIGITGLCRTCLSVCGTVQWPWNMHSRITWQQSCGHVCKIFRRQWRNEAKIVIFNDPTLIWRPLSSEPPRISA